MAERPRSLPEAVSTRVEGQLEARLGRVVAKGAFRATPDQAVDAALLAGIIFGMQIQRGVLKGPVQINLVSEGEKPLVLSTGEGDVPPATYIGVFDPVEKVAKIATAGIDVERSSRESFGDFAARKTEEWYPNKGVTSLEILDRDVKRRPADSYFGSEPLDDPTREQRTENFT
ncbi:hypothetical protein HYS97_00010 [Candidatus Daviesbacteria bacterium]|nr:hypothetical protein [Candidatus Daviesbacteria bacterium]